MPTPTSKLEVKNLDGVIEIKPPHNNNPSFSDNHWAAIQPPAPTPPARKRAVSPPTRNMQKDLTTATMSAQITEMVTHICLLSQTVQSMQVELGKISAKLHLLSSNSEPTVPMSVFNSVMAAMSPHHTPNPTQGTPYSPFHSHPM